MPKLHITKYKSIRKSLPPGHTFCTECGEIFPQWFWPTHVMICPMNEEQEGILMKTSEELHTPRRLEDWQDDHGPCLFFSMPIEEPPYCGTPLDSTWPNFTGQVYWVPLPDPETISQKVIELESKGQKPTTVDG